MLHYLYMPVVICLLLRRKAIKITIVGSRSANEKEIVQSKVLASRLAQEGYTIVSGFDNPM